MLSVVLIQTGKSPWNSVKPGNLVCVGRGHLGLGRGQLGMWGEELGLEL